MNSKTVSDLLLEFETNPQQAMQEFGKLDLYDRIRIRNEVREIAERYFDVRTLCNNFLHSAVETHPVIQYMLESCYAQKCENL